MKQRFEHMIENRRRYEDIEQTINYFACDGWELAAAHEVEPDGVRLYFKRPVES